MKKILFLCVAVLSAMSMSAQVTPMTCAEAAAACVALDHDVPGTDSVAVTGYITSTDGKISRGQQTFWMDDVKGTTKTFEGYWCNLPQEMVDNNEPLNVGDKVTITGVLLRHYSTYEMKNGNVEVLERAVVNIDTLEVSVCEAIEEGSALADGDNTTDKFIVEGVVTSSTSTNDTYHTQTFYLTCEDNNLTLQAYNVTVKDENYAAVGDSVRVMGALKKYGTQVEIIGDAWILAAGNVEVNTIYATVAEAVTAGMALERGAFSIDDYVVTGYVDSIAYAFNASYGNMSFYMCDDLANPTYAFEAYKAKTEVDIPVGAKVSITGKLQHYYKAATETNAEVELIEISNGVATIVTGIDNTVITIPVEKFILNGQMFIRKDGVTYNAQGAVVK